MTEVRVPVRVRPGASRTHVGGSYGDDARLLIAVAARPVDGAANDAVVRALADAIGVRLRQVTVAYGHSSRSKVLSIETDEPDIVRERLAELLAAS